ncbi:hypothetical protein ZTR_10886 [Talaromyces verruculosus]|nr:hypothetical protein ZTR_10886 [Talaromyces verruculosus]
MAYLWTTIKGLTAALLLSYAFWAYTEGEDPGETLSHVTSSLFGFGLGPGSPTAYGWPKKGGIYVSNDCVGINLEFLRFDRLGEETDSKKEMRLNNEQEEEAQCNKMRQLGATWWESYHAHEIASISVIEKYDDVLLYIGWQTTGGLWVLSMTQREAYDLERPSGLIYYNARDMDERCGMIERLGGTFYEDPNEGAQNQI